MSAVKKIIKTGVKAGIGAAAALLGAGALVYEGAMNTKINRFFINLFEPQEAPSPEDAAPAEPGWFETHKGPDRVIASNKKGPIHAYVVPAEVESHKWAVLCHGYNSVPESTGVFAEHYHPLGYNCICPSMRGWGNDEGVYCTMGYHDKDICLACINYIVERDPEAQIILHGYSMGAVTVMLATGENLPPQVKAAVADCGFTSCWEQYAHVIKSYAKLPPFPLLYAFNAVCILRGNFDVRKNVPIDAVRRSVTPTVFLHGTEDDFVPFSMMDRLYEACAAPKAKQPIAGADHANAVYTDPALYWKTVDGFLKSYIS